jgi:FixJ family two-component response regulator
MRTTVSEMPFVAAVDDDEFVGEAIKELLLAIGLDAEAYSSAEEFLASGRLDRTACLITDVTMRGMSGFELMKQLAALGYRIPTIVVTGYPSAETLAEAVSAGAVGFLPKPVAKKELMVSVHLALNFGR